ncbi:TetR/AcrR family transcriptional regulator [Herbiconiux sp. CPCC 205763]|uniref:TetR/AcrR family transcriptional regulator n=1 Tax=Herbiconiux aconitum TaxID=2970913 RepID=A0ABT2GTW0_9MICO|nr:TetR/AcrR family transcriptional regulator [Herbiconiux aconitum]MCS5718306.1 TetR/AcrR family transcriptional regulator [Herbiconiux aconitum]
MGRKSDGRERLLEAAAALLAQRPYSSIGVAEICAVAGVQKGSFYYFFPSKQALALAVIDEHWVWQRSEWLKALEAPGTLQERLHSLFVATSDIQVASLTGSGSVTGCLFGNLALELSSQDEPVRERLQGIFEEQIDLVEHAIREGVDAGEVAVIDPREAARSIVAQLEGLVLFAKLFNDPGQIDRLWQNSLSLLGLATPAAV